MQLIAWAAVVACFFVYSFVCLFFYYNLNIFLRVFMGAFVYLLQLKYLITIFFSPHGPAAQRD